MGKCEERRMGLWELDQPPYIPWLYEAHSQGDAFFAHSNMLIHGAREKVSILHLEEKDPSEAPYRWDHKFTIEPRFNVEGTTGAVTCDSIFLVGGLKNPHEGRRMDLKTEEWTPLPQLKEGRIDAASMMWDPHIYFILGGRDSSGRSLFSCEYLDTRTGVWFPFSRKIPLPLSGHAVTAYNDHAYISGGFSDGESRDEVWRCRISEQGPWDQLPSLKFKRHDHGMIEDGSGGLSVISGCYQYREKTKAVLEMETLTLGEQGEWETVGRLPFLNLFKATEMK